MSELKTLKDLGDFKLGKEYSVEVILKNTIKTEAIKWVIDLAFQGRSKETRAFIEFHNITEDDLK